MPWSSSSTVTLLSDICNCRIKSKNDPTGGSEEETHYNPRGSRVSLLKLPPWSWSLTPLLSHRGSLWNRDSFSIHNSLWINPESGNILTKQVASHSADVFSKARRFSMIAFLKAQNANYLTFCCSLFITTFFITNVSALSLSPTTEQFGFLAASASQGFQAFKSWKKSY